MKEIIGEIQNIKSNRKSLAINGEWFNSFTLIPDSINKGQTVKITYTEKKVDDKVFKNIRSIEQIKKDINSSEPLIKPKISDTTINCILMQSVQFAKDKNTSLEIATSEVLMSYKFIIENL